MSPVANLQKGSPYLSLKVEKRLNDYLIEIAHQNYRSKEFEAFEATNGVRIQSESHIEWMPHCNTFFVRGSRELSDGYQISVGTAIGDKIIKAVKEYNQQWWGIYNDWCVEGGYPNKSAIIRDLCKDMPMTEINVSGPFTPRDLSGYPIIDDSYSGSYEKAPVVKKEYIVDTTKRILSISTSPVVLNPDKVCLTVNHMSHFGDDFTTEPMGHVWVAPNGVAFTANSSPLTYFKNHITGTLTFRLYGHKENFDDARMGVFRSHIIIDKDYAELIKVAVCQYNQEFGYGSGTYCISGKLPVPAESYMDADITGPLEPGTASWVKKLEEFAKEALTPLAAPDLSGSVSIEEVAKVADSIADSIVYTEDPIPIITIRNPPTYPWVIATNKTTDEESPEEDTMYDETSDPLPQRTSFTFLSSAWGGLKNLGGVAALIAILGGGLMGYNAWSTSNKTTELALEAETVFEGVVDWTSKLRSVPDSDKWEISYSYKDGPMFRMQAGVGEPMPRDGSRGRTSKSGKFHPQRQEAPKTTVAADF